MRVSAVVIAKDEGDRIGPCLDSVAFCDEVLVLDSGSRDDTVAICRAKGARVIETDWPGWVAQKNRGVEAASHDWILSLDADERVDDDLRAALAEVLSGSEEPPAGVPVAWEVTRKTRYLGRWIRHGGWFPEWRVRLFHRRHAAWGGVDPHDKVVTSGPVGRVRRGTLEHHTYRSLADHVAQLNRFTSVAADELVRRGRRRTLAALLFRPPLRFLRMYVLRLGFLDGWPGLVLATMDAWYVFLKYSKAREILRREADPGSGTR